MQSLALPRPTTFRTPFGRPLEPEDGLAKLRFKFSPGRPEQQSYPSPPMSEPHSPPRRTAQTSEPSRHPYAAPVGAPQRIEASLPLPPPSLSSFGDPRSALPVQQRPLYSGEPLRGQSLQYHSGHAVDQSPYGHVQVQQNYTHGYPPTSVPQYVGNHHHGGPMLQQAAMIAPPPSRGTKPARRTKAHVASACVNCKKAHLSCDVQRPCGRCVASGKQDSCKDVQHKKRGRPRLRDDRDYARAAENPILGGITSAIPVTFAHQGPFSASHPLAGPELPRDLGRPAERDCVHDPSQSAPFSNGTQAGGPAGVITSPFAAAPSLAYQTLPVAFLDLDLVVQKSNQAFQELVNFLGDIRGKHLTDFLENRPDERLQRLQNGLRDERREREPSLLAPITPGGLDQLRSVMEPLSDRDIDHVSQGFVDRPMYLSFRQPGSLQQSFQAWFRLAKTSQYFVTLVVRLPSRPAGPPLLTQQLAPPTPIRTSQSMSAPTTAPVRDFPPHHARPASSTSSTPSSPYFNFSSVRTSLPAFSHSSYSNSPSYGYSPTAGPDTGYFPTIQPPSQPRPTYPSPYTQAPPRNPSMTSEPLHELNRPGRLEGLHLPPIRTGPAPLGSPLHLESQSATDCERDRVRRRVSSPSDEQRSLETPGSGSKRRRLGIHEVLE